MISELYLASQAGAEIDVIVRANCTLVPGIKGLSENIRVRSILGRFLEHSRLYCFEAHDSRSYYLGSADLMPRNLDHRIEVVVPVEDTHARNEIESIFKALLADNSQAWELNRHGAWERVKPAKGDRREIGPGDVHAPARSGAPAHACSLAPSDGFATMGPCPSGSSTSDRTPCAWSSGAQPSRSAPSGRCSGSAPTSRRTARSRPTSSR